MCLDITCCAPCHKQHHMGKIRGLLNTQSMETASGRMGGLKISNFLMDTAHNNSTRVPPTLLVPLSQFQNYCSPHHCNSKKRCLSHNLQFKRNPSVTHICAIM